MNRNIQRFTRFYKLISIKEKFHFFFRKYTFFKLLKEIKNNSWFYLPWYIYFCIFVKKINKHMKAFNLLFVAAAAISLVSCGASEEEAAEKVTYSLDAKASSLEWTGSKNPQYFHVGTVNVTEGSIEMEGDKLVAGSFKIDMNSIDSKDPNVPADKLPMLVGHLKDTSDRKSTRLNSSHITISYAVFCLKKKKKKHTDRKLNKKKKTQKHKNHTHQPT